jgi:hypothetical protein
VPVSMFAKIKIRRGLQLDLPDLDKAEFGFATDTGEVFIGAPDYPPLEGYGRGEINEAFPYRNIRIITDSYDQSQYLKYIYEGNGLTVAQTGPSPTQPVVRSFKERLDEVVHFNNFRTSTAINHDNAPDLNRAMREVYNGTGLSERKIIHIASGDYNLDTIVKIPPNTHLKGEGKDRTFLTHNDPSGVTGITHLIETIDSKFQENLQITFNLGISPRNIEISDMTITIPRLMDIVRLYRSSNITFRRVKFRGAGAVASTTSAIVLDRLGIVINMNNFKFHECDFENVSNIINPLVSSTNIATGIEFDNCKFDTIYNGIIVNNINVRNIKVSNSYISGVQNKLFELLNGSNFNSHNNVYDLPSLAAPLTPTIIGVNFTDYGSFEDRFILGPNTRPYINDSRSSVIVSKTIDRFTFKNIEYTESFTIPIPKDQSNVIVGPTFVYSKYNSVFIDYSVKRNGGIKIGTLRLTHDGSNSYIFDTFNTQGSPDISFSTMVTIISGQPHMVVMYSTPDSGATGSMKMTCRAFMS